MFRSAIIAGLGALGSELAQYVGRLTPDRVILVDHDRLESKNIARSVFWRDAKPGDSKALVAAGILASTFPHTQWISAVSEIADLSSQTLIESDILFSAVDTDLARMEIAAIGARYALDICDGGLGGTSLQVGRVSWFPHDKALRSACFTCQLSARRRAELLRFWEADIHACRLPYPSDEPAWSSTSATATRIARLQALAGARASRRHNRWPTQSLQIDLGTTPRLHRVYHSRSEQCPFHDDDIFRGELFPRCESAVCSTCGFSVRTSVRIGWLRRWGRCERCDGRQIPEPARQRAEHSAPIVLEADEQLA